MSEAASTSSQDLLNWVKGLSEQSPQQLDVINVNGTRLPVSAIYLKPDDADNMHARPLHRSAIYRNGDPFIAAIPDNIDYVQIHVDIPLPEAARAAKQAEKDHATGTTNSEVVADIAIEIRADTPNTVYISAWNGLAETFRTTPSRQENRGQAEIECGQIAITQGQHNPLALLANMLQQELNNPQSTLSQTLGPLILPQRDSAAAPQSAVQDPERDARIDMDAGSNITSSGSNRPHSR